MRKGWCTSKAFFCACGNSARAAGEFYAEISIRTCVAVEDLLFYLYRPRILLILCPAHPERGNQGRFQLLLFDNLIRCPISQKARCKKEGKESDLLWPRNFRHVKCHLWHSGDWEVTKDWRCLEYSNFQHCFSSIVNQLVVIGGTVDEFYVTLYNGRLTIWLKLKKQVEQEGVRSVYLKVVRSVK